MEIKEIVDRYLELKEMKEDLDQQITQIRGEIAEQETLLINEMTMQGQRAMTLLDGRKIVLYIKKYYSLNQDEKPVLIDMIYNKGSKNLLDINPITATKWLSEEGKEKQVENFVRITEMPRLKVLKN